MKKLIFVSAILFAANSLLAQVNKVEIQTNVDSATVYTTGALVHRNANLSLKKGRNEIVFKDISASIDVKSVQFSSNGELELLSVTTKSNYQKVLEDKEVKSIRDSIAIVENQIATLNNESNALTMELDLLKENLNIKGQNQTLSVEQIKNMSTYYRERTFEINERKSAITKEINEINKEKVRLNQELNELNYKEYAKNKEIVVLVESNNDQKFPVHIAYVVYQCGWAANYDLSAKDIKSGISLKYKAKVFNNTGNPWDDISLKLSTANPQISASAPDLSPWYLNNNYAATSTNVYKSVKGRGSYMVPQNERVQGTDYELNLGYTQNAYFGDVSNLDGTTIEQGNKPNVGMREIEVSALSSEFKIDKPYTIPADSKPYIVEIDEHQLEATFSHIAIPKLDRDAFLLAKIGGWEQLELVPGEINVYFADNYVGQSYMNTRNVDDSLGLSFGRDKRILVTRSKKEEFSDSKVIGNNRKDQYTFEIIVKNNRAVPVELDLYDQVPISQNSDISVTIDEISDAIQDEVTGELNWLVKLQPGESKRFEISFTIKYPKNKKVQVKQFRTISAPSF